MGKIDYPWGYEILWSNNDEFAGKIVVFEKAGQKTPLFMHKKRKKAWFVNGGKFKLTYIDVKTGQTMESELTEGQTVEMGELSPHSLESLEPNSILFEVGSRVENDDMFFLTPGGDQTPPEDTQSETT
jgi:hypothetical protein